MPFFWHLGGVEICAEELSDEAEYAVMAAADEIGTENFTFTVSDGNITITGLKNSNISSNINLVIPTAINGYPVVSIADNAFKGNVNIKSVTFAEGLRTIGYGAFKDCTNLGGSIELPASLTLLDHRFEYEDGAFQNTAVTSVKVNGGTTNDPLEITNHSFYNCSSLKSVTLSGRESLIGSNAFSGCANLETLTMPAGAVSKTIGDNAFQGSSIKELNIPATVTSIGKGAFYDCRALTSLTLNEGLTTIGGGAFGNCVNLTGRITIPSTVTELQGHFAEEGVFRNTSLTEVEFAEGGESVKIENYAFSDCKMLEKVTFPKHLISIGDNAFMGDAALEDLVFVEGASGFTIGASAFNGSGVTTLTLPKTVLSIGSHAFYDCGELTSLTLNEGLSTIGQSAFQNCVKLTGRLVIPSTVTEIGSNYYGDEGAFQNTGIVELEIADGSAGLSIGTKTFSECKSLERAVLPGRFTNIGEAAFMGDVNLASVQMESGSYNQTIGTSAFKETGIIELHIPSRVTSIGSYAFYGCKALKLLALEEGLEVIGESAFRDCTNLTGELIIPSTVQRIDGTAWYYEGGAFRSTSINSVVVKDGNQSLVLGGNTFADCVELGKVDLSNRISEIGENAFAGDASLVWVRMATERYDLAIEQRAFQGTSNLQVIALPQRLKSIGQNCFDESGSLTDIYYAGSEAQYQSVSVSDIKNSCYFRAAVHYNSAGPEEWPSVTGYTGWRTEDGRHYWYEDGVLQGYNPEDPSYRGKEIYDPDADAWFWLDNIQGGAMAVGKDVYQESDAGPYGDRPDGTGKWVRYDINGYMVKGFDTNENGVYYFDYTYGAMVKGLQVIDGRLYYFAPDTGIMQTGMVNVNGVEYAFGRDGIGLHCQWYESEGKQYWYENGVRQGYDPSNAAYRGKEIYDPESDAWYWLDNILQGAKAAGKEVYQDSNGGKWVRYDNQGGMIKGWYVQGSDRYYYDLITGAMYKGSHTIDGTTYYFDEITGIRR